MGQVVNLNGTQGVNLSIAKTKSFQVSCVQCQKVKDYESLQEVEAELDYNYDILALVYKHRPNLAEKAHLIYDLPVEDKQLIDIIQVNKKSIDEERMHHELKAIQLINFVFLQQQNQQKVLQ